MKTALITGAAKRIGREFALHLAEKGYHIGLHYFQSEDDACKTRKAVEAKGVSCTLLKADLSDPVQCEKLIPDLIRESGPVTLLVNNASVFHRSSLCETSVDLLSKTFAANFTAPFILIREYARLQSEGAVINIIDAKIHDHLTGYAAYTLSKMALKELTLMAAREFGPGIRVNGIAPGLILPNNENEKQLLDKIAEKIPLKRTGQVNDLLKAMDYLLDNEYVTGEILSVDGGYRLK